MFHLLDIRLYAVTSFIYCTLIHICLAATCNEPPTIASADADLQNLTLPFPNGTKIFYRCHDGYMLNINSSSNAFALCIADNETQNWHLESFICAPVCKIPNLDLVPYAKLKLEARTVPFMVGESIQYVCNPGYTNDKTMNSYITCAFNETTGTANWSQPQEKCRAKSCGYPSDIDNAERIGSLYTFPNNVTYICHEGFQLKGSATIYCMVSGMWRPAIPSCEAIVCPILAHPENGRVTSNARQYDTSVSYECNKKYRLQGDSTRTCRADATWSGSAPSCVEITCPLFDQEANFLIRPRRNLYKVDDLVILSCMDNTETMTLKCTETGKWNKNLPHCRSDSFTKFTLSISITHSTASTTDESTKVSENCDDPGDIKNGKRKLNSTTTNITLTYSCEDGYELRGQGTLICSHNGKWNIEKLPICVKPISILTIIGVVIGILLFILLGIGGYCLYQRKERKKFQGFGKQSKALTTDATDLEEIAGLDKGKKPIPVTVL